MRKSMKMFVGAVALQALLAGGGLSLGPREAKAGPVIANPSFEADPYTFTSISSLTGWTVYNPSGGPPYGVNNNTYGNTPYGSQFVALGGQEDGGASYIEQAISGFTIGKTYTLSFAMASEYVNSDKVNVSFTGSSVLPQDFSAAPYPGGGAFWYSWETKSETFVADNTTMTLHLHSYGTNYEPGIDNFSLTEAVTAVPEPATIVSASLAGLIALGYAGRRRKAKRAA